MRPIGRFVLLLFTFCGLLPQAEALDLSDGLLYAVPVPAGQSPSFDGSGRGWDLTGAEPVWYTNQLAAQMHATLAVNYDQSNLYVYARVSLPGRKVKNLNGPADPYWIGDLLEFRLASDPSLPRPLNMLNPAIASSNRICHISMWQDTANGTPYIGIQYGGMHGHGQGKAYNPPGSQLSIVQGTNEYILQAKLPWSVLNVPDGKNPFQAGQRMTAIFGIHWASATWFYDVSAIYSENPGDFAFANWGTWGQIGFSATGNRPPRHGTMEEALAKAGPAPVGVPITIDVPKAEKISVNILGPDGQVLRELTGGQNVPAGKFTIYWDGKDQWGFTLPPGNYRWGAYLSEGIKARYVGFVGSSGNPPYATADGIGGWGGDHGVPSAVAADASGIYFGWYGSEAEASVVKIDYAGKTLWRKRPFVSGGFGDLQALTSNGKYVFAAYSGPHPQLCRLDASTGLTVLFGHEIGEGTTVPIAKDNVPVVAPAGALPAEAWLAKDGTAPESVGVAATAKEVFASVYSANAIQVFDTETGEPVRTLACPSPRGLALDAAGNLYVASFGANQPPQILRFQGTHGEASPIVTAGLEAPYGVAVDAQGRISVTDEGSSQQVKGFAPDGKLIRTWGKKGGRAWAGTYDKSSYLGPSAVAADAKGGLLVAESSIPKIFDRIDLASGDTLMRWFGWPGYGVSNIGDADDPMTSYYPFEPEGFARATSPGNGETGYPDAYWVPAKAQADVNQTYGYRMLPFVLRLANDKKYFVDDGNPHSVSLIEGDNLLPVGYLDVRNPRDRRLPEVKRTTISMWVDVDGSHQPKPDQITTISEIDGKPLPPVGDRANSIWVDPHGNAYLLTHANSIIEIPCDGFSEHGALRWNSSKAHFVVSPVVPSMLDHFWSGPRTGMGGVRLDRHGNVYTCFNATIPALTPALAAKIKALYPDVPQSQWCVYANADLAKSLHEGLGHTAESNAVKFAKYGPDGKMLWMAGRKAVAEPAPGEMYHFWTLAGLVDDKYVAGGSEWGPIYFYTTDGYYVDALMNDPSALAPAGPYTFGSENFAGRIETYDKLGKVYAYDQGGIYAVDGFDSSLTVRGEKRLTGSVVLDKVYESAGTTAAAQSLQIVPLSGDASNDTAWASVPTSTLTRGGATLATVQLSYDAANLYARIHVIDDTPLQNGSDDARVVFKGGDVVGLDLGPAGDRTKPGEGDVRILAAMIHNQAHLVGLKVVAKEPKRSANYFTPASGNKNFDFVGDIPGGRAVLTPDADGKGYTALLTVPKSFLEVPVRPNSALKGDVEVLLSGIGQRGLQAVSRNWLFSGGHVETTMVDDVPTEAWLYPQYWGAINVK